VDEADIHAKDPTVEQRLPFGNLEMRIKSLVTERYTLTVYNKLNEYGDLFDRVNDPGEVNNLWYSAPELRLELVDKLLHEVINAQSLYPKKMGNG
jgi:hypothetical protein